MQKHLFSREEVVNLLQRQVGALGVEEVDQGDKACVEDRKVNVGPVTDALDRYWGDLDNQKGELEALVSKGKAEIFGISDSRSN